MTKEYLDLSDAVFYELNGHNIIVRADVPYADIGEHLLLSKCQRFVAAVSQQPSQPVLLFTLADGRRFITSDTTQVAQDYLKKQQN